MLQEFKAFISKGNVLDLAVAVLIGSAFGAIVTSVTEDLLMPLLAALTGNPDFSNLFLRLGPIPPGYAGATDDYAALKAAGVPVLGYGAFLTALVNFLIIAFAVFLLVRQANRLLPRRDAAPPADPPDVVVLREIRDLLKESRP
ncbi:large conductance mechanosensitive channel protein MscL [Thermaurantiacus sp.]